MPDFYLNLTSGLGIHSSKAGARDTMSPKKLNERFAIGSANGARSLVWRLFATGSDVYITSGNIGIDKISFHKSRICRRAFTKEHGAPKGMTDRVMSRWNRDPTPPAGSQQATLALRLTIPTDFLSTALAKPTKRITWIAPAGSHMSTVIEMFFTSDAESDFNKLISVTGRILLFFVTLPNGENFSVTTKTAPFPGQEFRLPPSHGHVNDMVFSKQPEAIPGRPLRLTMFSQPNDGGTLDAWEYGGYKNPIIALLNTSNLDSVSRKEVYDRKWAGLINKS